MKKIFIYAFTTALIWGAAGCKPSDFGTTNVDPSATTTPIISALLTNAEAGFGSTVSTGIEALNGGQYAQYFAQTQYPDVSLYSLPQLSFTGEYSGTLYDLQNIINLNQSNNSTAAAMVLQQYIFWTITDSWGDVPYSQALKGIAVPTPVYDTQQDIYKGILSKLTAAVAKFDASSSLAGDIIYSGDVASWKRAANSIRMLVALQLSKKFPAAGAYAATEFSAALNDAAGSITLNSQNMTIAYPGSTYKNPWFNAYDGRTDYAESKTMTDLLTNLGDTRSTKFGGSFSDPKSVTGGTVSSNVGVPPGVDRNTAVNFTTANPNWAMVLRADLRTASSPLTIISAAEVYLARAEAAFYGWTTEVTATIYNTGIDRSFEQWGVTEPVGYNVQTGVIPTSLKNIATQRYIASYPDGHMAWDIWRKTGFPVLTPAPNATSASKQIVQRFTYSTTEYNTNSANVKAAAALLPGGDTQDSKVWWAQ